VLKHIHLQNKIQNLIALVLVLFILVFPKGGIKIQNIPITWGYILLGILSLVLLPYVILSKRLYNIKKENFAVCISLLIFQIFSLLSLYYNGIKSIGFGISFFVSFFFIPILFLYLLSSYIDNMDTSYILNLIRICILLVAVYGIFLFFFKLKYGYFFEIPFLTVNYGDWGALEQKPIYRGGVFGAFKLISTYNNGNIYGVCILMLLPLYEWLENSSIKILLVKLSLILTLSRTVWFGLILYEAISSIYIKKTTVRNIAINFFVLVVVLLSVYLTTHFVLGRDLSFIFDSTIGGRIGQLDVLNRITFFPTKAFWGIGEIVYLSILDTFGVLGLILFINAMVMPLLLQLLRKTKYSDTEFKKRIALGLFIYLAVSVSDGAILYIPVMLFYWFLASLLLTSNSQFINFKTA